MKTININSRLSRTAAAMRLALARAAVMVGVGGTWGQVDINAG